MTPRTLDTIDDITECVQDGYYSCEQCFCAEADFPIYLSIIISVISLLISTFVVAGYISIKEMREQPGDIVFAISLCNIIFSVGSILENVQNYEVPVFNQDPSTCNMFGYIKTVTYFLVHFYHTTFSLFFLIILRGSLKSQNMPFLTYHVFPLLGTGFIWYILIVKNAIGRNIFGLCGQKTTPGAGFPLLYYGVVIFSTLILTWFTNRYLPKNDKISSLRSTFLRFYLKLIIILILNYLFNGILDSISGYIVAKFLQKDTSPATISVLGYISTIKTVFLSVTPILLPTARILDPLMREYWKRMFQACMHTYRTRRGTTTFVDPRRVSLDLAAVQRQLEKKSYIFQFQHNRRVQVVYSVLSGIHYFWRMKSENKRNLNVERKSDLTNSKVIKENVDPNLYRSQAFNKEHFPIDENILAKTIPELYSEIKDRDYDFSEGTFTAHAPEIFERIIQLDEVGRGIGASLDLKENFNRILKSGINGGGRSGEFFFFSSDNKIIIKTISSSELAVLLRILPAYLEHFKSNPDSVIAKIYGVFTFEARSPNEKYHLILMRNINGMPSIYVKRKYDLKGSTVGRRAVKQKEVSAYELQLMSNLKDLDFDRFEKRVHACPELSHLLVETIRKDAAFLASQNLIDYSLALYIVDKGHFSKSNISLLECSNNRSDDSLIESPGSFELDSDAMRKRSLYQDGDTLISMRSTHEELYYHLGIIDYLIPFNCRKKLEVFSRKLLACNPRHNISVQRPAFYADRFVNYMERIFSQEGEQTQSSSQEGPKIELANKLL